MGDKSANGTSLVASSHSRMANDHMSDASQFLSLGFFERAAWKFVSLLNNCSKWVCQKLPSGDIQAGW